jgi:hypothetical protein
MLDILIIFGLFFFIIFTGILIIVIVRLFERDSELESLIAINEVNRNKFKIRKNQ